VNSMAVCASQFVVHLVLQMMSGTFSLVSSPHPRSFCMLCSCQYWAYISSIGDILVGLKMGAHLRKGPPFAGKGSRRQAALRMLTQTCFPMTKVAAAAAAAAAAKLLILVL